MLQTGMEVHQREPVSPRQIAWWTLWSLALFFSGYIIWKLPFFLDRHYNYQEDGYIGLSAGVLFLSFASQIALVFVSRKRRKNLLLFGGGLGVGIPLGWMSAYMGFLKVYAPEDRFPVMCATALLISSVALLFGGGHLPALAPRHRFLITHPHAV